MPSTQTGGIKFADIGGYRETFRSEGGNEIYRPVQLAWSDRQAFHAFVLGQNGIGQSGFLARGLPEQHPVYRDFWVSRAEPVEAIGVLGNTPQGGPNYTTFDGQDGLYRCALVYTQPDWLVYPDDNSGAQASELYRYVARSQEYNATVVTIPGNAFKYVNPPPGNPTQFPIPEPPGKIFPTRAMTYTWKAIPADQFRRLPRALETSINDQQGTVNDAQFDGRYDPGTLLFASARERGYWWANNYVYDLSYNFIFRQSIPATDDGMNVVKGDHNYFFRLDRKNPPPRFWLATDDGTVAGNRIYGKSSFDKLFKVG